MDLSARMLYNVNKCIIGGLKTMPTERALANAAASIEMEGFVIDEQYKEMVLLLIDNVISYEEYTEFVKRRIGI